MREKWSLVAGGFITFVSVIGTANWFVLPKAELRLKRQDEAQRARQAARLYVNPTRLLRLPSETEIVDLADKGVPLAKLYLVLQNLFRAEDVDEDVKKKITPVLDTFRTALADGKEVLFRGDNEKDLLKTFLEKLAETENAMYMAAILSFLDGTDPAPTDESGPQESGRGGAPERNSTPGKHPRPDRPEGASSSQSAPKDRAWWRVHEAGFGIP